MYILQIYTALHGTDVDLNYGDAINSIHSCNWAPCTMTLYTIQYFICAEQTVYLEVKTIMDAITNLIATTLSSYPKSTSPVLIFFQHFVFGIADKQSIPPALVKLVGSLQLQD